MSALFGSLQHVGGLLATMWSSFQLSLERLPLHRALAQSQCLTIKRMHMDEPFICDWLEGKRWLVCIKGKSVSIVGAFWSEQQKINNCQIVFLVSLKWFKRWIKRIWVTYSQVHKGKDYTAKTFLKGLIWSFVSSLHSGSVYDCHSIKCNHTLQKCNRM